MYIIKPDSAKVPIKSWVPFEQMDNIALQQAKDVASHPAISHHVAIMPDCHAGYGLPVGGVAAFKRCVVPYAVGVDIGCGMLARRTPWKVDEVAPHLSDIVSEIKKHIPMGFNHRSAPYDPSSNRRWGDHVPWEDHTCSLIFNDYKAEQAANLALSKSIRESVRAQIGTLGGGNHFIELQTDSEDNVWFMIHSGSRNIGKQVCDYYHDVAKNSCCKWFSNIPNENLSFLPIDSQEGASYINAMKFCMGFAAFNRYGMKLIIENILRFQMGPTTTQGSVVHWSDSEYPTVSIHHNYASLENHFGENLWVHRKGAICLRKDDLGIIPGSMGTNSYIVRGRNNPESFYSASHGAGRNMSRTKARSTLSMDEFAEKMRNVHFTPTKATLDESPMAYKDIKTVMAQQRDLINIVTELSPLAAIKDETKKGHR